MSEDSAQRFETFVTWYLRSNGYFTVPNFVVHAGDDPSRISGDVVGNQTEVDTLAVRLPYSRETSPHPLPTDPTLVEGAEGRFDVVFAEVKSGHSNTPNRTWRELDGVPHIEYVLRYLGWHEKDAQIKKVAAALQSRFLFDESRLRIRYIIFAKKVNVKWQQKGVKFITFDQCIQFIAEGRGQCWAQSGVGSRSIHYQWPELVKRIFQVANGDGCPTNRQERIRRILEEGTG